jgi:glycolate oxidase iron-sulfur subunit
MQTELSAEFRETAEGREADAILRACVHCGFCTATCPTYQLLGDELDGPRGRIYLIKQVLEGDPVTSKTQTHLDRCLTCRNCETTCPSGVRYGRLLDIGRAIVERKVGRTPAEAAQRWGLRRALLSGSLFTAAVSSARILKGFLPRELGERIPANEHAGAWPAARHARKVLLMEGCVQPTLKPNIDAATARVFDRIGISVLRVAGGGCCGALSHHLGATDEARSIVRRNIDAWWPHVAQGAEAIVVTASGCAVMVKDYAHFLAGDPAYASKARRIADIARDPIEIVTTEWRKIAPLHALGHSLLPVADAYTCCGSAGTYSVLQPKLAGELKVNKLRSLEASRPDVIATANIGCMTHLESGTRTPVRHWIELLDKRMMNPSRTT